ncbi:MAG: guanylate kinase [Planctomycetes bacterium]|nr:guanylate kinase [Planctomycetota bacterium]
MMRRRGLLIVLSGPAGSGKSTLADQLMAEDPDIVRTVTATTRKPRPGEVDGKDYFFITEDEFKKGIAKGDFVEHNEFNGNYYGTLRSELEKLLQQDKIVVLVIDVNGSMQIRKSYPNAVHIFLLPPTPKDLRQRLCGRGTECVSDIEKRLNIAKAEIDYLETYNFIVINDDQSDSVKDLQAILKILRPHYIRGGETEAWEQDSYQGWHRKK